MLLCPAVSPASLAERSTCPAALPFGLLMHPAAPSLLALSCSVGIATLLRVNIWLAAALQEEEKAEEEVGALGLQFVASGAAVCLQHLCAHTLCQCWFSSRAARWGGMVNGRCTTATCIHLMHRLSQHHACVGSRIWLCAPQGREPVVPELSVDDLAVAVHRGTYNACVDLATQVGGQADPAGWRAAPSRACLYWLLPAALCSGQTNCVLAWVLPLERGQATPQQRSWRAGCFPRAASLLARDASLLPFTLP